MTWVVPYTVPSTVNTSALIGTNSANDVKPSTHSTTEWAYSLFDSYGGGTFVPYYSKAGAYFQVNSGGHQAPANMDAAGFDFEDAAWKRVQTSNGPAPRVADYTAAETSGTPLYEITGYTNIPAPSHTYAMLSAYNSGTKGSVLIPFRSGVVETGVAGQGVYSFDLATGAYTRHSTSYPNSGAPDWESQSLRDDANNRWYFIRGGAIHYDTSLRYLDGADWTYKGIDTDYPSEIGSGSYGRLLSYPAGNMLVFHRGTQMQFLNLANPMGNWQTLPTTGTIPASGSTWIWNPRAGAFYMKVGLTGSVIQVLTPPATNPQSNNWTLSTITIGGDGLPDKTLTTGNTAHYTGLMYVPAIDAMAWVYGPGQPAIFRVSTRTSPIILTQPSGVSVLVGGNATFTVDASDFGDLTFQWQSNAGGSFANITGATSASYTKSNAALADTGVQFRCVLTDSAGSINSDAAALTVEQGVGIAAESDAALSLTAVSILAAGRADTTDTALALAPLQVRAIGLATEADTSLALGSPRPVGIATQTDTALALAATQIAAVGVATQTEAALALAALQARAVGVATETDVALALGAGGVVQLPVGMASESSAALQLQIAVARPVGVAIEANAALALAALQARAVGVAAEVGIALTLSSPGQVVLSAPPLVRRTQGRGRPANIQTRTR